MSQNWIALATLGAAHGINGEIRVKSHTQLARDFAAYSVLSSKDGSVCLRAKQIRSLKGDMFIVAFEGLSRSDAEKLNGVELGVARSRLPQPNDDEFYHIDLIGLQAQTPEGIVIGQVVGLLNYGAGDIVEIATCASSEPLLVPFTRVCVPHIDFEAGKLIVCLPDEVEGVL